MAETCRLCRKGNEVFLESIFDYKYGFQISEMAMKIIPIIIVPNDELPKWICEECLEITVSAFQLQKTSIESENWYRSQFGNLENVMVKTEQKPETFYNVKVENFSEDEFKFEGRDNTIDFSDDDSYLNEPRMEPIATRSKTLFNPRELPGSKSMSFTEKWYQCNFCDTKLKPRSNMMRHMKRLHDPIAKPFACSFCVQRFEDEGTQQSHELIKHAGDIPTTIFCDICGASGNHKEGMDRHKSDDHNMKIEKNGDESEEETTLVRRRFKDKFNPRPVPGYESLPYDDIWYSCSFCDKQLKPRKSILRHIRLKHDPEFLPFGCGFCIERFDTAEGLSVHNTEKHSGDEKQESTTIFCDICGISGQSQQGIDNHKADDHQLAFYGSAQEVPEGLVLQTRKRKKDNFNPRPLPGSEKMKYDDIGYQCSFCPKQLKPRRVMLRHIRLKHDPERFPHGCRFCIKRFELLDDLQEHEAASHNQSRQVPAILFCDLCGISGDGKEGMEVHMTDDHLRITKDPTSDTALKFACSKCEVGFQRREQLEQHVSLHHTEKSTKCNKCSEKFRDKLLLRNHVMMIHDKLFRALDKEEIEQDLTCCACSDPFLNERDLLIHVETHRPNFSEVKCIHCPVPVRTFDIFMKHVRYHMKAKTHQCNQCQKIFSFDGKFICHVNSHKRCFRKKMSCEKCGSKFRNARELEIHDKVKHNKETLFICPICAKSLGSATILDNHIKYVHNGEMEKKHECKVCSLKFTHKSKLVRHEATHSKLRPHICEVKEFLYLKFKIFEKFYEKQNQNSDFNQVQNMINLSGIL